MILVNSKRLLKFHLQMEEFKINYKTLDEYITWDNVDKRIYAKSSLEKNKRIKLIQIVPFGVEITIFSVDNAHSFINK